MRNTSRAVRLPGSTDVSMPAIAASTSAAATEHRLLDTGHHRHRRSKPDSPIARHQRRRPRIFDKNPIAVKPSFANLQSALSESEPSLATAERDDFPMASPNTMPRRRGEHPFSYRWTATVRLTV